jgi:signal transduction histidine kinase
VAVLVLAASAAGAGPPWIVSPRPLDAVAVGLVGVVAGALALRRRYPIAVLVVLNAVALAWAAAQYPGPLITLAPLIACYTLAALRGWRWGLAGAVVTALSALVAIRVAFGAAVPAGISGSAVWMAATVGAAGTAVGYYRALLVATRAQLAREAQTREEQARRRAVEERLRIARELHDVFGHTMATISVQAGVGIHLLQQRPAQAVEALTRSSRSATRDWPTSRSSWASCAPTANQASLGPHEAAWISWMRCWTRFGRQGCSPSSPSTAALGRCPQPSILPPTGSSRRP